MSNTKTLTNAVVTKDKGTTHRTVTNGKETAAVWRMYFKGKPGWVVKFRGDHPKYVYPIKSLKEALRVAEKGITTGE